MNILISRCLLGVPCRYDGKSVPVPGLEAVSYTHLDVYKRQPLSGTR